jgi:hypothetical protein
MSKPGKIKFRAETLVRESIATQVKHVINTDRKARILIVINVAVISVLTSSISYLRNEIEVNDVQGAIFIILLSNCVCLLFSIRSVGQFNSGTKTNNGIENILSYHRYSGWPIESYLEFMREKLSDKENLINLALIELYDQGQLLRKKSHLLNFAFATLGIGLTAGLSILIAYSLFH